MAEQKIGSHRDLTVWQKSMDLVVEVYRLSSRFPREETYEDASPVLGLVTEIGKMLTSLRSRLR